MEAAERNAERLQRGETVTVNKSLSKKREE